MDSHEARELYDSVINQPLGEEETPDCGHIPGFEQEPIFSTRGAIVFDTENLLRSWAKGVSHSFPQWPGEQEGEVRPADHNVEIFRKWGSEMTGSRDSLDGDRKVYQNANDEDGLIVLDSPHS